MPESPKEFKQSFYGVPFNTEAEDKLRTLARQYHEETEAYDRTVCTGPIGKHGIMPASQHERRLSYDNAIAVSNRLFVEAKKLGFDWMQWQRARGDAAREQA